MTRTGFSGRSGTYNKSVGIDQCLAWAHQLCTHAGLSQGQLCTHADLSQGHAWAHQLCSHADLSKAMHWPDSSVPMIFGHKDNSVPMMIGHKDNSVPMLFSQLASNNLPQWEVSKISMAEQDYPIMNK